MKKENPLKVAANNVKRENQVQVKNFKRPKYLKLGEGKNITKVLTPKKIIPIKMDGHDFMVFGDPRCKDFLAPLSMFEQCKENREVLIVLRTKKSNKHPRGMMAFSRTIDDLLKSRKWRLVNAQSIHMVSEFAGEACETPEQFMKSELRMDQDEEISDEDLELKFLSSLDDKLICQDIVRVLQLYYQQNL
jgi:hypothetical protein